MARPNPFLKTPSLPGSGEVHLTLLPPANPAYSTLTFTYPLKLVPSTPHFLEAPDPISARHHVEGDHLPDNTDSSAPPPRTSSVPLLFLLSYGGGLLPPDAIDLTIRLDPGTRLTVATQGSTKIFPSQPWQAARSADNLATSNPPPSALSNPAAHSNASPTPLPTATQTITAHLGPHSALCLTPDPTQPFRGSRYVQKQRFYLADETASLLLLDWTTEGRRARGESWDAGLWKGCNEVWRGMAADGIEGNGSGEKAKLQLRDQVMLEADGAVASGLGMRALRQEGMGCFGTLVAVGPLVMPVGDFFVQEFEALPRVGGRDWGDGEGHAEHEHSRGPEEKAADSDEDDEQVKTRRRQRWRKGRLQIEKEEHVFWTAARVRGLVLVKFTARDAHGAKRWLGEMLTYQSTTAKEFGDASLMCVR